MLDQLEYIIEILEKTPGLAEPEVLKTTKLLIHKLNGKVIELTAQTLLSNPNHLKMRELQLKALLREGKNTEIETQINFFLRKSIYNRDIWEILL